MLEIPYVPLEIRALKATPSGVIMKAQALKCTALESPGSLQEGQSQAQLMIDQAWVISLFGDK